MHGVDVGGCDVHERHRYYLKQFEDRPAYIDFLELLYLPFPG